MNEKIFKNAKSTLIGLCFIGFAAFLACERFAELDETGWFAIGACAFIGLALVFGKYDPLIDSLINLIKSKSKKGEL